MNVRSGHVKALDWRHVSPCRIQKRSCDSALPHKGRMDIESSSHTSQLCETAGLGWTKGPGKSMILCAENGAPCLYVYGVLRVPYPAFVPIGEHESVPGLRLLSRPAFQTPATSRLVSMKLIAWHCVPSFGYGMNVQVLSICPELPGRWQLTKGRI